MATGGGTGRPTGIFVLEALHARSGGFMDLVLEGKHGKTLRLQGDRIVIATAGAPSTREKVLPLNSIAWVAVKKPGVFDGYIQFALTGSGPRERAITLTGGAFDAAQDENSVVFDAEEQYRIALQVKEFVESVTPS